MKSITLFSVLFLVANLYGQDEQKLSKSPKKHDLSVGFLNVLRADYGMSYDYLINENSSIGTSLSYASKYSIIGRDKSRKGFTISLNYKRYLSKKKAQGMYFQPVVSYEQGENYRYVPRTRGFSSDNSTPYKHINVGLNMGYKYVHKSNFYLDGNVGLQTKIIDFSSRRAHNFFKPNLSLSIGKRF